MRGREGCHGIIEDGGGDRGWDVVRVETGFDGVVAKLLVIVCFCTWRFELQIHPTTNNGGNNHSDPTLMPTQLATTTTETFAMNRPRHTCAPTKKVLENAETEAELAKQARRASKANGHRKPSVKENQKAGNAPKIAVKVTSTSVQQKKKVVYGSLTTPRGLARSPLAPLANIKGAPRPRLPVPALSPLVPSSAHYALPPADFDSETTPRQRFVLKEVLISPIQNKAGRNNNDDDDDEEDDDDSYHDLDHDDSPDTDNPVDSSNTKTRRQVIDKANVDGGNGGDTSTGNGITVVDDNEDSDDDDDDHGSHKRKRQSDRALRNSKKTRSRPKARDYTPHTQKILYTAMSICHALAASRRVLPQ
ncbi:hypothetical protein FRC03_002564 [Tulasnella sp. 419]|nr:hypothetical protein FRC03_002564 [Tulasnella sp. 419]